MLAKLIDKVRTSYAIHQLNKLPVVQHGRDAIAHYWTDCHEVVKDFSKHFVEEQATGMMEAVIQIAASPDPRMANRERLTNWVLEYARFQVLVLEPSPADDPTGIRGKPGVTGELRAHLLELAHKDEQLREFMHGLDTPKTWDDVWNPVLLRYRVAFAWAHLHHMLRVPLNDWNQTRGKDWFKPFVEATCATYEHQFRQTLGMPPVLGNTISTNLDSNIEFIVYGSYMHRVMEGTQYPDLAWNDTIAKFSDVGK